MLKNFNKPANIETEKSKSKVWLFTGILGSGKTTAINNLLKNLSPEERENTILIINDVGSQNIDFSRLQGQNKDMEMTAISGNGCICCGDEDNFAKVLKQIRDEEKKTGITKNIFIEPSGIAEPDKMNAILAKHGFESLMVNCVNPIDFKNYKENSEDPYDKATLTTIETGIKIADIIFLPDLGSYLDEETEQILNEKTQGKIVITMPKGDKLEENITGEQDSDNALHKVYALLKNTKPRKKQTLFKEIKEEDTNNEVIPISRENFHLSRYKLANIVKVFGQYLIRAKGTLTDNKEFNIRFGGDIDIERLPTFDKEKGFYPIPEHKKRQFNFIFRPDTPQEILEKFEEILENPEEENKKFYEKYFWSAGVPEITKPEDYIPKIQKLISQLHEYKDILNMINSLDEKLKEINNMEDEIEKARIKKEINKELKQKANEKVMLGDDMKYDNPIIWLQYKNHAYRGTPSEIPTIGAFIEHCFSDLDYICGKRIDFFAKNFEKKFGIDIFTLNPNISFDDFLKTYQTQLENICQDEKFMNLWLRYEYFTVGEKIAKWKNYRRSKKFYDLNSEKLK